MATRRQKKANRKNAKRGTGPRTPEGKARSSLNASNFEHGLFARDTVLPEETPQEFLELIAELEQELQAVGGFECRLVRHIADTEWGMSSETQDQPSSEGEVDSSAVETETRPAANQPHAGQVDRTPATSVNMSPRGPTRISPQIAVHV